MKKAKLSQRILAWVGATLLKCYLLTLRVRVEDPGGFFVPTRTHPYLVCIWHNRILGAIFGHYSSRTHRPKPMTVLTSASTDGGMLEAFVRHFNMGAIRGSSSRRGAAALLEIRGAISDGFDIAITPDGPRGPCYSVSPGILFLAAKSSTPIIPCIVKMSAFWKFGKRWDAFRLPKPFSRIVVNCEKPITVGSVDDPADLNAATEQLKAVMGED